MEKITFEQALEKIREIVVELEGGELSLDASIERFRDGTALLDEARQLIADAELKVKILSGDESEDA
ncbi:MAG: exodeoxyribonuclease VII small subunit [Thermomicrobiales bacterium]|nr:exodeoxyribonuclease VII small subunit [Thermomicrobiales bacterium]